MRGSAVEEDVLRLLYEVSEDLRRVVVVVVVVGSTCMVCVPMADIIEEEPFRDIEETDEAAEDEEYCS